MSYSGTLCCHKHAHNSHWTAFGTALVGPMIMCLLFSSCSATKPPRLSTGHISHAHAIHDDIPEPVVQTTVLPPPLPKPKQETFTIVVNEVPVKELLFALARDAKLNVDIHPAIKGIVTINAVKQTLPQILRRLSEQVDLRYEVIGSNLFLSPDMPYFQTYRVDYVNMSRKSKSVVNVATEISTTGGSVGKASQSSSGNSSKTELENLSENDFWKLLEQNIKVLILQKKSEETGSIESILVNPMSGIVSVRATSRQHEQIQAFIDKIISAVQRQVLIEATIVEVELNDGYESGVDWQSISKNGINGNGFSLVSTLTGANLSNPPSFLLSYKDSVSNIGNFSSAIRLLESFGNVKVLSSPKLMALNNQTALLKVVDEKVYFSIGREIEEATDNSPRREIFTSEIHTIPVGLVMSVTPQITENEVVTMNVRPTISRITGFAVDPAPYLAAASSSDVAAFDNLIPEIQIREMESLLKVNSSQTVVLGGLMQNKMNSTKVGIPLLSAIPFIGSLFSYTEEALSKTELVIFLRPTVIHNPGLDQDLKQFRQYLPQTKSEDENTIVSVKKTGKNLNNSQQKNKVD